MTSLDHRLPETREKSHVNLARFWIRCFLLVFGWTNVGIGLVGIFIPGFSTTVFLIVAFWAFSKSSRKFQNWLWFHPKLGPSICLAPTPCDAGSRQGLRRRDDGYQLHLYVSFRCKRLDPAYHPGCVHDPRRYVHADPGQRTTPNSSSGHRYFQIGLSLNRFAFAPMQTDNAEND